MFYGAGYTHIILKLNDGSGMQLNTHPKNAHKRPVWFKPQWSVQEEKSCDL